MATLFDVQSQVPSVLVTEGNKALDVVEIGFVTKPHGIYAQTPVPASTYQALGQAATILDYVEPLAMGIEQAMSLPGVLTGRFVQDFNPATGLLDDYIYFSVGVPGGNPLVGGENSVDVPVLTSALQEDRLYQQHVLNPIENAYGNVAGVLNG